MFECELLKAEVITYVLSLAFQVAGSCFTHYKIFGKDKRKNNRRVLPRQ